MAIVPDNIGGKLVFGIRIRFVNVYKRGFNTEKSGINGDQR
jgi:hypothetical protein